MVKPVEHHLKGKPIPPSEIRTAMLGLKPGEFVWVYLRLAQDPRNVYLGKVKELKRPGFDWKCWRIGTVLAFHADPTRWSSLGKGGVEDRLDEVLWWIVTDIDVFETGVKPAMTMDEFVAQAEKD